MNKKIIAFGASNSRASINKEFVTYAGSQLEGVDVEILDLNDFEMPIYSIDREKEGGIPSKAHEFKSILKNADGILISFAEHNGTFSVAFKNIYDWISRIEKNIWYDKPMLLLATSPGARGGKSVLETAYNSFSRNNQSTVLNFSLPSFHQNYSSTTGIVDEDLKKSFDAVLKDFKISLNN